jgi:hypothetical protein
MDEIHIDTVRIRALAMPTRHVFPDGTVFEQVGDGTFKRLDLHGNTMGYFKAESVEYLPSLKEQRLAARAGEDAVANRILDAGIDRTPQQI